MGRCLLELCLGAVLLWAAVEGRPTSVEQLPDGTDVMLSSMGLVEGPGRQHELQTAPHPDWQRPTGVGGLQPANDLDTEDGLSVEGAVLRQLLQRLLSPPAPLLQPARQRRGGSGSGAGGAQGDRQHLQLTRQLLRHFEDLQKRSYPYNRDLLRQARGYMCLSKVCNFKGARGK